MLKPRSKSERRLRRRALELTILGVIIGVAVVLIRIFTPNDSAMQWAAFAVTALLVTVAQFVLRRSTPQSVPSSDVVPAIRPARPQFEDLFANEADRSWTGLADASDSPALTPPRSNRNNE